MQDPPPPGASQAGVWYKGIMNTNKTRVPLLFSDETFGTEKWGFIPRLPDADDEDMAYTRHLRRLGVAAQIVGGVVRVMHDDCDNRGGACSDCRSL